VSSNDVFPDDPTSICAEWMQTALSSPGLASQGLSSPSFTQGASVTDVEFAGYIGTGQMGRNARYRLTWDNPVGRPSSVVGKFPTDDPTGRASGFDGSYQKEFTFYTQLASTVMVRAPKCYVARFDQGQQNFVLLMEDLAGSAQGDQMRGLNADEAELAVEQAVALHAPRWGDSTLAELSFGETALRTREENAERLHMIYDACLEPTLARLGPNLPDEAVELARRFAPKVGAWTTSTRAPATIVHMDFRPDNFLFGVDPEAPPLVIVDWQTLTAGPGTHDLAYMIGGSFEPEERRRVERSLVESYCQRLAVTQIHYPFDACWRDFRISSLWGVAMSVIATMLAAQTERGDLMLTTMLRRHANQAIELDALDLIA
jgi:Phosphotransferase enzyme family